jgi:hypothetical protein
MPFGITEAQVLALLDGAEEESEVWHVARRALKSLDAKGEWVRCAGLILNSTDEQRQAARTDQRPKS